jgi:hypothetical protein
MTFLHGKKISSLRYLVSNYFLQNKSKPNQLRGVTTQLKSFVYIHTHICYMMKEDKFSLEKSRKYRAIAIVENLNST